MSTIRMKSVKSDNPFIFVILTTYDIVKAHGGGMSFETQNGREPNFTIQLPAK